MTITDEIRDRLSTAEVRLTPGRREVLEVLARSRGPLSATEIDTETAGVVPLSSIYRTLAVLSEAGIVAPHHGFVTRYELAEPLQRHHHHLVCVECGQIDDVEFDTTAERTVQEVVTRVGSDHGFTVGTHALEIEGTCRRCS